MGLYSLGALGISIASYCSLLWGRQHALVALEGNACRLGDAPGQSIPEQLPKANKARSLLVRHGLVSALLFVSISMEGLTVIRVEMSEAEFPESRLDTDRRRISSSSKCTTTSHWLQRCSMYDLAARAPVVLAPFALCHSFSLCQAWLRPSKLQRGGTPHLPLSCATGVALQAFWRGMSALSAAVAGCFARDVPCCHALQVTLLPKPLLASVRKTRRSSDATSAGRKSRSGAAP